MFETLFNIFLLLNFVWCNFTFEVEKVTRCCSRVKIILRTHELNLFLFNICGLCTLYGSFHAIGMIVFSLMIVFLTWCLMSRLVKHRKLAGKNKPSKMPCKIQYSRNTSTFPESGNWVHVGLGWKDLGINKSLRKWRNHRASSSTGFAKICSWYKGAHYDATVV